MRKWIAIVGREWRSYFFSPLAYVILSAFLLVNGIIFYAILSYLAAPGAAKGQALVLLFTNTYFWIFNLFVVPIIAMRLFPEERRSGTIENLLTAPVSETEVVLGKWFGALVFFLTLWAPTLLYVAFLRTQTRIDIGPVASGYLGVALLGGYFLKVYFHRMPLPLSYSKRLELPRSSYALAVNFHIAQERLFDKALLQTQGGAVFDLHIRRKGLGPARTFDAFPIRRGIPESLNNKLYI